MGKFDNITALFRDRPKTDRDLVREAREEISQALAHEVTILEIFEAMQTHGFKSNRKTFTKILEEQGLYTIRKGHKKVEQPKAAPQAQVAAQPAPERKGPKIWGGRYQKHDEEVAEKAPETPPPADSERNVLDILRERNPKIFIND